jgi:hypothetical protein
VRIAEYRQGRAAHPWKSQAARQGTLKFPGTDGTGAVVLPHISYPGKEDTDLRL